MESPLPVVFETLSAAAAIYDLRIYQSDAHRAPLRLQSINTPYRSAPNENVFRFRCLRTFGLLANIRRNARGNSRAPSRV